MRLLMAMLKHETNTFSPVETPFQRFFKYDPHVHTGAYALEIYTGTGSGLGGFIDLAQQQGAEIDIALAAESWPSGPVSDETYEQLLRHILDAVQQGGYDGILLDLHGAMVTESLEDAEGELLRRIRELDPHTPIGVTLDMHTNLYENMVSNATVLTGYHTYPHVDMYDAGFRCAQLLVRTIRGEITPVLAWGTNPMLPHVMQQGTHMEPNKSLQARCIDLEQKQEVLAASLFVGFPNADIHHAGLGVVVCTDAQAAKAQSVCDALLQQAWEARHDFVFQIEPLAESVARAKQIESGPVVLLDHYDNSASGGTMDTTAVLAEVLRQGLENAVFYAIYDPEAVQQAISAGIDAEVTLMLGGKTAMPALTEPSHPVEVTGRVKMIFNGRYRNRGPMYKGVENNTGPTVVLDTGKVEIVLISEHQEPFDLSCLLSVGVDPYMKKYVVLKSRVHWRAGFGELAQQVIECAGLGVCTSDYSQLEFKHVRRPIFPLDPL